MRTREKKERKRNKRRTIIPFGTKDQSLYMYQVI